MAQPCHRLLNNPSQVCSPPWGRDGKAGECLHVTLNRHMNTLAYRIFHLILNTPLTEISRMVQVETQKSKASRFRHPFSACQLFLQNDTVVLSLKEDMISILANSKTHDKSLLHLKIPTVSPFIFLILNNMAFV